ncbi:ABC transporter permease [Virgibacillus halodenitrificans]|uniref:ABC transporter permease n=1 Tax=Virgibacillus halodenitrificans TaxID=1482 RepID=UPI00045D275E|nr:ABC transporter permease [Virgibacillus halodenitrificans]MCG1029466.1 ABC transporter permease [Virgibacillus halodenitrificans]MCJ0932242.1 ABC transporter permease [Virgibacillus halodenitrificans]MYL60375.1 ABC transporter permease [Virgibacillus halodenitrificans]CDQ32241.1 ABC-2 family transporter protein [Virgibacillus halodenitrificans]
MNKFWIILSHTYMSRVKTKSFVISTVITLLLIVGMANFQSIVDMFADDQADKIAVIDETNELFDPLNQQVENTDENIQLISYEGTVEDGKNAVQDEDYSALLVLDYNDSMLPKASYFANNISEAGKQMTLTQQLQQLKISMATEQSGISEEMLAMINAPVEFQADALDKSAKTDEELNQARGIVYVMLFLLYMSVMLYGQMIATDVATEKSSRVMEILVSSASPVTHMFAKIVGIALLGLTQVILFIGVGYLLISSKKDELTGGFFEIFGIQDTSPTVYLYAILFFILGYLLYATLAAMLGSLVSRVEDVQQLIMPMVFLILIAFFIAMFGIGTPDSALVRISSFIPFFTPMVMFLRVGMLDVPVWEVSLSIGILIASIILLAIIGARVYKGGVLMYGRSSSLKDLKKAIVLSKKE